MNIMLYIYIYIYIILQYYIILFINSIIEIQT